jgi:hypothetical protein
VLTGSESLLVICSLPGSLVLEPLELEYLDIERLALEPLDVKRISAKM